MVARENGEFGLGFGFLEYLDFVPGMEGGEGEDGVPIDLKLELFGGGGGGLVGRLAMERADWYRR